MTDGRGPDEVRRMVADNLRVARARTRRKQQEIADAMQDRGFDSWSRVKVSEVERYNRAVTVEELWALADIYDMQVIELLGWPAARRHMTVEEMKRLADATGGEIIYAPPPPAEDA